MHILDDKRREYIAELVNRCPGIKVIWLFGSRVTGEGTPDSDWDFLAFADDDGATYQRVKGDTELHQEDLKIDLFVEISNMIFEKPWGSKHKRLNLYDMNWNVWSPETSAEYNGEKGVRPTDMVWSKEDGFIVKNLS
jgi:predicted nucleotidyltransferase